ncbi:MAG TPA: branched-chain amino acid ABC transporter permease [Xanthobacteraceae bacterium]|nr:branched-chain amino acid ABC transporter permease [Xanthobacteraceae bacterium]
MTHLTILLDGLAYGMVLFIISVGLTVTMGLMRVVNLAHGAFAMIGGYAASVLVASGFPFAAAAALAVIGVALIGAVAELTIYRPLYRKGELPQSLMTFGFTFVVIATLTTLFGTGMRTLPIPAALDGLVDLGFRAYPLYRLFLIAVGLALFGLLWVAVDGTLIGARLRAAVDNPRMSQAVGVNVNLLFTLTFAAGCALAAFGAVVGAQLLPLDPYYALRYLVLFLVVVGVGGLGNFKGSFVAAIVLGIVETSCKYLVPSLAPYIFYSLVLALLLWKPAGLMPARSAR